MKTLWVKQIGSTTLHDGHVDHRYKVIRTRNTVEWRIGEEITRADLEEILGTVEIVVE